MDNFGSRVRSLCKQRGITVQQVERDLRVSNGYVHNIEARNGKPKRDILNQFASYFDVTPEYLIGETQSEQNVIPVVNRITAGIPIGAQETLIGQEVVSDALAATGTLFALKVEDDSMDPFICDGDVVIVRRQETADNGDVVIVSDNECDGMCRCYRATDTVVMLIPKNLKYDPLIYARGHAPISIIGKVVEVRRRL